MPALRGLGGRARSARWRRRGVQHPSDKSLNTGEGGFPSSPRARDRAVRRVRGRYRALQEPAPEICDPTIHCSAFIDEIRAAPPTPRWTAPPPAAAAQELRLVAGHWPCPGSGSAARSARTAGRRADLPPAARVRRDVVQASAKLSRKARRALPGPRPTMHAASVPELAVPVPRQSGAEIMRLLPRTAIPAADDRHPAVPDDHAGRLRCVAAVHKVFARTAGSARPRTRTRHFFAEDNADRVAQHRHRSEDTRPGVRRRIPRARDPGPRRLRRDDHRPVPWLQAPAADRDARAVQGGPGRPVRGQVLVRGPSRRRDARGARRGAPARVGLDSTTGGRAEGDERVGQVSAAARRSSGACGSSTFAAAAARHRGEQALALGRRRSDARPAPRRRGSAGCPPARTRSRRSCSRATTSS